MKIRNAVFMCVMFIQNYGLSTPQHVLQDCQTAVEISKKFQAEELTKEESLEILVTNLEDYTHKEGKLATLTQFINHTSGLSDFVIKGAFEQRGWSGNEVCAIQSKFDHETKFFLKIFAYDSKFYLPEIFGLAFMHEIDDIGSPLIQACGQCVIDEKRYFLVLESLVPGQSIQNYFRKVGECAGNTSEREISLKNLCKAAQACGEGLAKFHSYVPAKLKNFPNELEKTFLIDLEGALNELKYLKLSEIEIEAVQNYAKNILKEMKEHNHFIGLVYDDIKTVHTFYELETKKFSLVNPARIYFNISKQSDFQGLLISDFCKYLISLTLNRFEYFLDSNQNVYKKELLTLEEVNLVKRYFEFGYEKEGGTLPSMLEKEYVFLQHHLFFIKNLRRAFPEPELTRVRDLIEISLQELKSKSNNLYIDQK